MESTISETSIETRPSTSPPSDPLVDETLRFVNGIRREHGLDALYDLRAGYRQDVSGCAIANSLSDIPGFGRAFMSGRNLYLSESRDIGTSKVRYETPTAARVFVTDFDLGRYPRYEI